jgi:hypothetical protein
MVTDIHARVRAFLQDESVETLTESVDSDRYRKAGVIPYTREEDLRFYVMKPLGERPELGEPAFQLCKGTRMYHVPGVGWRDMRSEGNFNGEKETLAETALREGIEELGLKLENIHRLIDLGPYSFSSATTGRAKEMWLFAAEVKEMDDFASDGEVAFTTEARKWVSAADFAIVGRPDHHYILGDIAVKLTQHHKE